MSEPRIKKLAQIIFTISVIIFILTTTHLASAQILTGPIVPCGVKDPSGNSRDCTICDLGLLVDNLTRFFVYTIALPAAALLFTIGGVTILTAGPSENRYKLGRTMLTNTIIGFIIVLLAWIAVDTTIKILVGGNRNYFYGLGKPWYTIPTDICQ